MNKKEIIINELNKYDFNLSKINRLTEIRVKRWDLRVSFFLS